MTVDILPSENNWLIHYNQARVTNRVGKLVEELSYAHRQWDYLSEKATIHVESPGQRIRANCIPQIAVQDRGD